MAILLWSGPPLSSPCPSQVTDSGVQQTPCAPPPSHMPSSDSQFPSPCPGGRPPFHPHCRFPSDVGLARVSPTWR